MADSLLASSPEISGGRVMTVAPLDCATEAMRSVSVETYTRSMLVVARALRTALATRDTPWTGWRFLSAMPLEPPRAGMMATVLTRQD